MRTRNNELPEQWQRHLTPWQRVRLAVGGTAIVLGLGVAAHARWELHYDTNYDRQTSQQAEPIDGAQLMDAEGNLNAIHSYENDFTNGEEIVFAGLVLVASSRVLDSRRR